MVIDMMWYGGWGWGGWLVMGVFMVLFWALLIAGVIALVHYLTSSRHGRQPGPPPPPGEPGWGSRRAEDVLAERFAHGEIDEDEYKRRLALLREHR
ncbi:SHOCT domain-containing protein [Kitasatospora cathayae]|uniref:SHOCT domain-containing protein n=1 Tax=Kitasatospora cathayae TaxID=3004092 RepID=A0ABY7QGP0_9ACTN|nr:SHOCT domain-containing protein [Kitasatospora sp. HUAS 3-15]WBP91938.1 SHOCT domain-containing protein [Kitasatospora sp. HUAS 3-15]